MTALLDPRRAARVRGRRASARCGPKKMSINATGAGLRVWATFRTGLNAIKRNALVILSWAVISRFLASEAVSRVTTFADTFGVDFAPCETPFVFVGSLAIMWTVVVPVTVRTIEAPLGTETSGTFIEQTWHAVRIHYRALSAHAVLRSAGLLLISWALVVVSLLLYALVEWTCGRIDSIVWLGVIGVMVLLVMSVLAEVSIRWSIALPAMIMEGLSVRESLRRSWHLTESQESRVFALAVLTTGAAIVVSLVLVGVMVGLVWALRIDGLDSSGFQASLDFAVQTIGLAISVPSVAACYYYLKVQQTQ